ncbi:MAG: hypothetical protein LBG44_00985 [Gemmatimonadota bacterium]|jgi:hypothetical protein|nr:hypothetical protein [Gemmatimonadota bacterium]
MLFFWILFFFVAFGAKVLLAFVMVYLLLPSDGRCARCDGETLLLRTSGFSRLWLALAFGRLQWRWCPRCGTEGFGRRIGRSGSPGAGTPTPPVRSTNRH